MKVYEILILISAAFFIIYYNFLYNEYDEIVDCIEISASNYNPDANKGCKNCCIWDEKIDCSSAMHPCLCSTETNFGISECLPIKIPPIIYPLEQLKLNQDNRAYQFHNLINSAYTDHYYSKIMEISQITYMNYVHSDHLDISKKTPQYELFLSTEFLKRGNYKEAIKHIDKFLDSPKKYSSDPVGAFFINGVGCCGSDIDLLTNKNHDSFQIAKIIKEILIQLDSAKISDQFLKNNLNKLMIYDKTPNSIDLIENIIFSILFSIEDKSLNFEDYGLKSLDKYDNVLLSSFSDIFKDKNAYFYLSSQINIMVYLKLIFAENLFSHLNSNHILNSLQDIEVLNRYSKLQNLYDKNFPNDLTRQINGENQKIKNTYAELSLEENEKTKQVKEKMLKNIFYNESLPDQIIKSYRIDNNKVVPAVFDDEKLDSVDFIIKSKNLIDYNFFLESISRFSNKQWYPIFNNQNVDRFDKIDNNKYFADIKTEFQYYISASKSVNIYRNDLELFKIFRYLFELKSPDKFFKIKTILKNHNGNENTSKILIQSLAKWNQTINGK